VPSLRGKIPRAGIRLSNFSVVPLSPALASMLDSSPPAGPTKAAAMRFYHECLEVRGTQESDGAFAAMRQGLVRVVPPDALGLLTWRELETLAVGEKDVDVARLRQHVQYVQSGIRDIPGGQYNEQHPVIRRLWTALESFTNDERVLFLEFVWGRSRLPQVGQWPPDVAFKVGPLASSAQRALGDRALPIAHTCFFQIELPAYSSERVMKEKLLVAMHGACGVIALA
jgi:HECT-domain (ubiquitin-transferase)